ncbi:glucose-6-phosphatase catalytic subunit 1-like [Macrobrachium rosenbergii]|uniref:glucose-6-phosphatase catalytic subunit 1-like n=1 Tax=Macrobrachium rosenbergii TaxID=79674 RepID=UPI0034D7891E
MENSEDLIEEISIADQWNLQSIETISFLQDKLQPRESFVVQASVLGDNREVFTFFFPIIAGLKIELGARALWAAILVEWSNLILKWAFKGDRPYWWVGETYLYSDETRPKLRQFANTCEAGPGMPSGHLMMNTAFFFVVVKGIISLFIWDTRRLNKSMKIVLTVLLYSAYALWIGVIFISRLYIQAHFIHQCVFGIVVGLVVGHLAWSSQWLLRLNMLKAIVMANMLFAVSVLTYMFLMSQGLDPLWSIPLALRHCTHPENVKIDTQPFYLMVRFTGAALGLGLGIASEQYPHLIKCPLHIIRVVLGIKGGILIGRMASIIQANIPTDDMVLFLTLSLGINIVLPYLVVCIVPHFLISVYPPNLANRNPPNLSKRN